MDKLTLLVPIGMLEDIEAIFIDEYYQLDYFGLKTDCLGNTILDYYLATIIAMIENSFTTQFPIKSFKNNQPNGNYIILAYRNDLLIYQEEIAKTLENFVFQGRSFEVELTSPDTVTITGEIICPLRPKFRLQ